MPNISRPFVSLLHPLTASLICQQQSSLVVRFIGVGIYQQRSTFRLVEISQLEEYKSFGDTYNIQLFGIKSHRCADDAGWEWGCDEEEPYVTWVCFGPNYFRAGRTENGSHIVKGSEYLFRENTAALSTSPSSNSPMSVKGPLFFLYQVCEADPGGPKNEDVVEGIASAGAAVVAFYEGEYLTMAEKGVEAIIEFADIAMKIAAKGDDLYPIYAIVLNEDLLLQYTSGNWPGPQDQSIFESEGNGDHFSIRLPKIKKNGKLQWTVGYAIFREE